MTVMKRYLACTLLTVVSLGLSRAVFAASEEYLKMTGTVVEVNFPTMTIETATKERVAFHMEAGKPKVGEKVTVYYDPSRRDHRGVWFAMDVEKAGKSEKGSKRN